MNFLEYINHPVIVAFGMTLVHSLWQIILIALAWRITIYLTRNSATFIDYYISLVSLLAIPAVFLVTFLRQLSAYGCFVPAASLFPATIVSVNAESRELIFFGELQAPGIAGHIEFYSPLIVWLYLSFVLILSFKSLLEYTRIKSLRIKNLSNLPDFWQTRVGELVSRTGLRKSVPVFLCPGTSIPVVAGFIKPVILLPLAMLSSLDVRQVETILLHEFYHVRNYDHLVNTIQNFLEILFFFHPATWWISSHVRSEREKRVDELVVSATGKPLLYAKALLTLETKRQVSNQAVIAATGSKNQLLIRIKNIMTMENKATNPVRKTAALLTILISAIVITALDTVSDSSFTTTGINNLKEINNTAQLPALPELAGHQSINYIAEAHENSIFSIPETSLVIGLEETKEIFSENQLKRENRQRDIADPEISEKIRLKKEFAGEEIRKSMEEIDPEVFKEQMRTAREEMDKVMKDFESGEFREEMMIAMQELHSDDIKEQIRRAGEEMKIAIQQFDSEEFREQMRKAREEMSIALREFDSEDFREEIRKTQEEMRITFREFNTEEFREQMRKGQEEMKRAIQEINSDEVKEQMRQAIEEIKRVIGEIKSDDTER
jgi:bla regulator protein blaR1